MNALESSAYTQVQEAYAFAQRYLLPLERRTNQNYAEHGLEVAKTVAEISDDPIHLSVALLHDLLLHPKGKSLLKKSPLSQEGRALLRHMHSLRRLRIDANTRDLDAVIDAFSHSEDLLLLRMAHRVNDVRHMDRFTLKTKKALAHETLHMYSAIAGRLGLHRWRTEMEDTCFHVLQPRAAKHLLEQFERHRRVDMLNLEHARQYVLSLLKSAGISCTIELRLKGLYSTYRKMLLKRRRFEELTDRLALRIIVPTSGDCYRVLGIVHGAFHPIAGKLKDYIGAPKENGYRSIHTVVYPLPNVSEQSIEVQIRTKEMHEECEFGLASHAQYKQWLYTLGSRQSRANLLRNLQNLRTEARSLKHFEQTLRTYFRDDQLVLFDENDTVYHLPSPVSALDFVCHANPSRVSRLKSIRVNGREEPLSRLLHDGDVVEALFTQKRAFLPDWCSFCHQASSRKVLDGKS